MSITENDIRSRTRTLLEAYEELTGCGATPSIDAFLAIRTAAKVELAAGVGVEKSEKPKTARKPRAKHTTEPSRPLTITPAKADTDAESPAAKVQPQIIPTSQPQAISKPKPIEQMEQADTEEMQTDSEPLSAFEILRQAADPWNE